MNAELFNRKELEILPLIERVHDLDIGTFKKLDGIPDWHVPEAIFKIGKEIVSAKHKRGAIVLMMGAHVLRSGTQRYLIDLMERGYISCLAVNGAGVIHDFELALVGGTTESVAKYIIDGRFGLWKETGTINDIINNAYAEDPMTGLGVAIGRAILEGEFPYKEISVFAAAARLEVPVTVHVGIGYDIIHQHPNCNGASTGQLSYNDFLKFVSILQGLEDGVVMNFGSAVMAPEVLLKGLNMARNVARQKGRHIRRFCTLVCDLRELGSDTSVEPEKSNPAYYFRPWKTMLVRTVKDGGKSFYVRGPHSETVPALWSAIGLAEQS